MALLGCQHLQTKLLTFSRPTLLQGSLSQDGLKTLLGLSRLPPSSGKWPRNEHGLQPGQLEASPGIFLGGSNGENSLASCM